jgi:hypothetical protein
MHRHVAFVAIEGSFSTDVKTRRAIEGIVRTAAGVDSASVRVSLELAALSFAFDPTRASFASIHRSTGRPLARIGLRLSEIKILDGSAKQRITASQ